MLLSTAYCPLAAQIADYLINAGHSVFVLDGSEPDNRNWHAHTGPDFAVVDRAAVPVDAVDCEIVLDGAGLGAPAVDRLGLRLLEPHGELDARCVLDSDRGELVLSSTRCPARSGVDGIREALVEACVDAIIALCRGAVDAVAEPGPAEDRFAEFLRFEQRAPELLARARRADHVRIGQLAEAAPGGTETTTLEYRVPVESFQETQLEWLCLFLQSLLNSRKSGVYSLDLSTPGGTVRKYVQLAGTTTSHDLTRELADDSRELLENRFYNFRDVFGSAPGSGMSAGYDTPAEDAFVVVEYRGGTGLLRISESTGLPFFAHLREHLDAFFARLPEFDARATTLDRLTALPESLHERLIVELNDTARPYDADQPIHRVIERQAARTPDAPALIAGDTRLTYRELDEAANRLAHLIHARHRPQPGDRIALYLDRTEQLMISVLATLKLGCAYVPLDLGSPANRTALILASSRPALVLADTSTRAQFDELDADVQVLTADEPTGDQPATNLDVPVAGTDLAYVIYTSGTTGNPKGVAVEHRNFANIAADIQRCLDFRAADRMLAVTTIAFDISTLEIFLPLMYGGSVVLASRADLLDIEKLVSLIDEVGVTVVQATPSLWQLITQRLDGRTLPIRALCGGEALTPQLAAQLAGSVDECWNVYGPTETTVWSTRCRLDVPGERVTIGRPLANTTCYVLDERGRPVPPGVLGELYIGGAGVARGYFNDDELTARRFVPDPVRDNGQRVYRTGDLVRYLPSGELEFVGRNDFQIKLRGHRIELGEIESALLAHPGITQSLVVVGEGGDESGEDGRFLAGYYVAGEPLDEDVLREYLAGALPGYMVPTVLIHLAALPLNVNGKVDRGALPDPVRFRTTGHVAPGTELEGRLCTLWQETLGRAGIGVTDDFFRSGGNSILGITLVNRINSELGSDIKIRDLFREKTIRALAPLVSASNGEFAFGEFVLDGMDTDALYEPFPLSNVQQTYYLGRFNNFELSDLSTHVYTEFRYTEIDHDRLERAFNRLIQRHLALRTVFEDGLQRFLREVPYYRIEFHDLADETQLEQLRETYSHKGYDPEHYPLFDVVLSKMDGVYRLHVSFDAIIVDMTSFGILFTEWGRLYREPGLELPEPGISYRDYLLRYEDVRGSDMFLDAQDYWQDKADGYQLDMKLPIKARPASIGKPHFRRKSRVIPAPVWRELSAKCHRYGISPTALILELYGRVLGYWSGQDRLCVNLTLFNRLPLHPDINAVIGDFTVLGLFDYRAERELGIAAKLRRVHDELLSDIDHNLFDGVDFQRLLKLRNAMPVNKIVAPVVLTSTLGGDAANLFELPLDESYDGVDYAISQTSQVWLDNKAYETEAGFVAEWDYVDQLFDEQVIDAMHESYCWLIERVAELDWEADDYPELRIPASDLALIEAANAHRMPRSEHTLVSLCEHEAGERIAVVDAARGESFRYDRLRRDVHRLACALDGQDATVAVLAEKGYLQAVATLGIMTSGAAYVPMHVEWPVARVGEVMAQAGVRTLLVSRAQAERPEVRQRLADARILVLEDLLAAEPVERTLPEVRPDDVAYVIFTSGSTGRPKGVTISHRGAVNTVLAVNERFGVGPGDRVLALSELSFDLSVYDIFGVLAVGGTVVFPAQDETRTPAHWAELVARHRITVWNSVPQLAGLLADEVTQQPERISSLRVVMMSGDWIPTSLPGKLHSLIPDATVLSLGGATEGSIWSIWYEIGEVDPAWTSIPYGVAMPNQRMYVLDDRGAHCPVGVPGEIHIGGDGVALNYWGDAELTAQRYIEHPELGRLYRTGDLGRWARAGYIEFLGRDDFQVKLNGYRVELEEISAKLSQLSGVDRAVVAIQRDEARDDLVGYLVPTAGSGVAQPDSEVVDKAEFLLADRGVLDDARPRHRLSPELDDAEFALAKSYRRFLDGLVDVDLLTKRLTDVRHGPAARPEASEVSEVDERGWSALLGRLSAVALSGRVLPKYLYPSAGGAYPVRTFVRLARPAGGIGAGCYYYQPRTHELCEHELADAAAGDTDGLTLAVHWPAITPLYGERSREMALLETGHMLALLTAELDERGVRYDVDLGQHALDEHNTVLCRITLGTGPGSFTPDALRLACFTRGTDGRYTEQHGTRGFDLAEVPVFERVSEAFAVLREAPCVLTLEGERGDTARVSAGFLFQRLRERLHADGLGSCMLGLNPTGEGVYTMAAGLIEQDAAREPQTEADVRDLTGVVNDELAELLPSYMLPGGYRVLPELPLSANGKVAPDQLPAVRLAGSYVEPRSETEWSFARLWGRILDRPPEKISAAESFFTLGGNSLSAMKLVRALQRDLGADVKLRDLYRYDTIIDLAEHLGSAPSGAEREEGEL